MISALKADFIAVSKDAMVSPELPMYSTSHPNSFARAKNIGVLEL